jgi:DNA polymerase III subunit gamma/tau
VQHYVLRKPGLPALVKVLDRVARAEGIETSEAALDLLARAADGSYRDALGLLDQIATYGDRRVDVADALELLGAVARETVFELVDLMAAGEAAGAFELLQETLDGPVDPEQAMRGLVTHLRYVCLLQQGAWPRDEWAFSPEEVARLQAQANQLPDAQVVRGLDLLADAQVRIRNGGADPRLQLELVAARLSRPALDPAAAALAARIESLEAGRPAPSAPAAAGPPAAPPRPAAPEAPPAAARPPAPATGAAAAPAPPPDDLPDLDDVLDADPGREDEAAAGDHAPEPPPAPASAVAQGPADLEHMTRLWTQVLEVLEREAPSTRGFLDGSRPERVEDGEMIVAVTSTTRASMLARPENRERVRVAVLAVSGHELTVDFVPGEAPPPSPTPEHPVAPRDHEALLEELKTMFGAVEEGGDRT